MEKNRGNPVIPLILVQIVRKFYRNEYIANIVNIVEDSLDY